MGAGGLAGEVGTRGKLAEGAPRGRPSLSVAVPSTMPVSSRGVPNSAAKPLLVFYP